MKKLSTKSLSLNLHTLRSLTEVALRDVAGGDACTVNTCPPTRTLKTYVASPDQFILTK